MYSEIHRLRLEAAQVRLVAVVSGDASTARRLIAFANDCDRRADHLQSGRTKPN